MTSDDHETWAEGGVVPTLNAFDTGDSRAVTVVAHGFRESSETAHALRSQASRADKPDSTTYITAFHSTQDPVSGDVSPALGANAYIGVNTPVVRRLTPLECERLQGFPDGWTAAGSDTQRYKQMGNAVTVNVIAWIGERMNEIDALDEGPPS